MVAVIDADQHLYEPRGLWRANIDPSARDDALELEDDDRGYTWLTWRGRKLELADVHRPGDTAWNGEHRERLRAGEPSSYVYDDLLPASYHDVAARVAWLDEHAIDQAVCFPNFGLLWERRLSGDLAALRANMAAWNRHCAAVVHDSGGRLHPVAHLSLRGDLGWLDEQLRALETAGVRLAMVAPAPVDGRPLAHPDHEPIWSAFVDHGITPVFHVADQPRVFDDCWYGDDSFVPVVESVFLWVPAALATTDLILHGVFDRHPELRIGIVELSSIWVPQHLLMMDGGYDFTARLNGRPEHVLSRRPSEIFLEHVRVASFSYESPMRLVAKAGDVFMCCSDFPHSEGTASPLADYDRAGATPAAAPGLFHDNVAALLRAT